MKRVILPIIVAILVPCYSFAGAKGDSDAILKMAITQYDDPTVLETLEPSVCTALKLGIHSQDVFRFVSLTAEAGRDPEEVAFYLDTSTELYELGVPAELVINNFLEEIAKGIPKESIKKTLPVMKARMIFCRNTAFDHTPGRKREHIRNLLIKGLFHAMSLEFSEEDISTLSITVHNHAKSPTYFFNVIKISMELKSQGFGNRNILALMTHSIENDFTIEEIKQLPLLTVSQKQEGRTEEDIVDYLFTSIESSHRMPPSEDKTGSGESKASKEGGATPGGSSSKPDVSSGSKSQR